MFKLWCLKRCSKLSPPLQLPLDWYKTLIKFYLVLQRSSAAAGALELLSQCQCCVVVVQCGASSAVWPPLPLVPLLRLWLRLRRNWREERQRSESRRPAPGSLALAAATPPHWHTGDMSWLGITIPRPPINKLKIASALAVAGNLQWAFTLFTEQQCVLTWCDVSLQC